MKLGIMQPYFFPYIGYWQLISYVDSFIIYDDVTFIKGGWINRNRYLYQGEAKYFNIIMDGASSYKKINEINLTQDGGRSRKKLLSTISMAYKKAPQFRSVYPLVESIVMFEEDNMAKFIENSIRQVCTYLGISTEIFVSSNIEKTPNLTKDDRVIDICKRLKADTYINAIGGRTLYTQDKFNRNGLELGFIKTNEIEYKQFDNVFVPGLSILDVMMFNSQETISAMLDEFTILK